MTICVYPHIPYNLLDLDNLVFGIFSHDFSRLCDFAGQVDLNLNFVSNVYQALNRTFSYDIHGGILRILRIWEMQLFMAR